MTPEQQRIAIAEACPFVIWADDEHVGRHPLWKDPTKTVDWPIGFDPLNDLNAMHEAEKGLPFEILVGTYYPNLCRTSGSFPCWATASQRAEAFIRTIGKWS